MQSYQLVTKQTSWCRNSFSEESRKLSLMSVTKRRELSKRIKKIQHKSKAFERITLNINGIGIGLNGKPLKVHYKNSTPLAIHK